MSNNFSDFTISGVIFLRIGNELSHECDMIVNYSNYCHKVTVTLRNTPTSSQVPEQTGHDNDNNKGLLN